MASASRIIPARISKKLETDIREDALLTFKSLMTSGVSRIDFLVDKKSKKHYVNEINTIPGSLSFYLWEPVDLKYKDMINELIRIAIDHKKEKEQKTFTHETKILENFTGVKGAKGTKKSL